MKNKIALILILTLLLALCAVFAACKEEGEEDKPAEPTVGLEYTLNEERTEYSVTSIGAATETDIVIASEHNGLPVTSISEAAFKDETHITSVFIPGSVRSIGEYAFNNCYFLNSVTMEEGVTSIGDNAFYNCDSLTSTTIPDSVTSIGSYAFYGCSGLTNVIIGDRVTSIGNQAFYGCTGLTDVYYQGDLSGWLGIEFDGPYSNPRNYADNLYINGELLQGELVIPEGTEKIGYDAFLGCTGLTSIVIPDSVTSIGDYAFA